MKKKKRLRGGKLLLTALVVLLVAINYNFLDKMLVDLYEDYEIGVVERVIDGDTIVINGTSIRLLGINTPEKGELYYNEAKEFLENKTLGILIKMERGKTDLDLYNRKLRYVYVEGENVNLKLVENGLANYYFPSGKDVHYEEFKNAWQNCILQEKNLCEPSEEICASCIELEDADFDKQAVELINNCNFYCDLTNWSIKDEGRKKLVFPEFILRSSVRIKVGNGSNSQDTLFWEGEEYVWTETGDTLFLRDKAGRLVLWQNY